MPFWSSTPEQFKQTPSQYEPQQQSAFMQILQQALGQLQNPQQGFAPIAQQARSQFETQTIPNLVEQFTAGAPSGERSSAFAGALGSAGSGLEENLASMGSQYGLQQQGLSQRLLGMGLTPQKEFAYQPEGQSGIMQLLGMLVKGAGGAAGGMMAGGPMGSLVGGTGGLGSGFSDMFGSATEQIAPQFIGRGLPGSFR